MRALKNQQKRVDNIHGISGKSLFDVEEFYIPVVAPSRTPFSKNS